MQGLEYIFVAQLLITLMLSVVFFLIWRTVDPKPHALSWSLAFLVMAGCAVLNAARDVFPSGELYWVVVNAGSLTAQALAVIGFAQRAGRRPPRYLLPLLVLAGVLVVLFTYPMSHMGLRMVIIPYTGALAMVVCAWLVVADGWMADGRKPRAAERGAQVLLLAYGLTQAAAGTVALMQGAERDAALLDLYSKINFLSTPAALAGLGIFGVLLIADDLAGETRQLALTDRLTGIMNRRGFEGAAELALAQARRRKEPTCLAVIDLDRFKEVNDRHGHAAGDQVLQLVARELETGLRAGDVVGRLGGDEFVIVLPATVLGEGERVAERLRLGLASQPLRIGSLTFPVTASFGVVEIGGGTQTSIERALEVADAALYRAKGAGRNRVEILRPGPVRLSEPLPGAVGT